MSAVFSRYAEYAASQLAAAGIPLTGFGFHIGSSLRLYSVEVPAGDGDVLVHEVIMRESPKPLFITLKARIKRAHWNIIGGGVAARLNDSLVKQKQRKGSWKKGHTPLAEHFGKELLTLAYAIENLPADDEDHVRYAILNWCGMCPEENWWLFLKAEASQGWRASLAVSLASAAPAGL